MSDPNPYSPPKARLEDAPVPLELNYAGFWRRFGAYWLDALILLPLSGLYAWWSTQSRLAALYYFLPGLLFGLWYQVYLVKRYGGTVGKLLLGIRIVQVDGSPAGYREATLRFAVLFVLSTLTSIAMIIASLNMSDADYFALGWMPRNVRLVETAPAWYSSVNTVLTVWVWSEFIVMLTNKRRRALHDFMAGTVVIKLPDARPKRAFAS